MNTRLQALAKRVDDLGETITMFKDPVDGSTVAALGWEELERILNKLTGTVLDGATNEPAPEVRVTTAGEFAAKWNTGTPADRERITTMLMRAVDDAQRCFIEDHDQLKDALAAAAQRIVELETRPKPPAEWLVLYWHDDCAKCEDHAESAVTYAQVTGSTGATHQETEVVPYDRAGDPSFRPGIAHGAKVKRAV